MTRVGVILCFLALLAGGAVASIKVQRLESEKEFSSRRIEEMQIRVNELEKENRFIQEDLERFREFKKVNDGLTQELAALREWREEQEGRMAVLTEENAGLRQTAGQLTDEKAMLQSELEAERAKTTVLEKQVKGATGGAV